VTSKAAKIVLPLRGREPCASEGSPRGTGRGGVGGF